MTFCSTGVSADAAFGAAFFCANKERRDSSSIWTFESSTCRQTEEANFWAAIGVQKRDFVGAAGFRFSLGGRLGVTGDVANIPRFGAPGAEGRLGACGRLREGAVGTPRTGAEGGTGEPDKTGAMGSALGLPRSRLGASGRAFPKEREREGAMGADGIDSEGALGVELRGKAASCGAEGTTAGERVAS